MVQCSAWYGLAWKSLYLSAKSLLLGQIKMYAGCGKGLRQFGDAMAAALVAGDVEGMVFGGWWPVGFGRARKKGKVRVAECGAKFELKLQPWPPEL